MFGVKCCSKVVLVLFVMFLSACGGGSSSEDADKQKDSAILLTGTFIDSPVENLRYRTKSQSGFTNKSGKFFYQDGEMITFSIGNIDLPSVVGQAVITPIELVDTVNVLHPDVIKIAQLLQSIDVDQNANNGIEISVGAHQFFQAQASLNDFDVTGSLQAYWESAGVLDAVIVEEITAIEHFKTSIGFIDTDDDGVSDDNDHFPTNNSEYADFDLDGFGDNADLDDDNDGVDDFEDLDPFNASIVTKIDVSPDTGDDGHSFSETVRLEIRSIDNTVASATISIVALDHNFEEIDAALPPHQIKIIQRGVYELEFDSILIEQVNIVAKARLNNTDTLYAPLYSLQNDNEKIKVNVTSHYVLKKLFDTLETAQDLEKLIDCNEHQGCANQFTTKANLLEQITLAAQAYELDFSSTYSFTGSLDALESALVLNEDSELIPHLDFKNHIETAVAEITRTTSPIAKGTPRSFNLLDGNNLSDSTTAQKYNSVMFGLSFASLASSEGDEEQVSIAAYTSHTLDTEIGNSNTPVTIFPTLHHTYFILDKRRDSTISEIPFLRTALTLNEGSTPQLTRGRDSSEFEDKSLISHLSDTFLSTEGFLLIPRILEQFTDKDSEGENNTAFIGWQFDPLFSKLYQANEYETPVPELEGSLFEGEAGTDQALEPVDYGSAPTWLLTANLSKAAKYALIQPSNEEKAERVRQEEESHIFSWEIHGLETTSDFSLSQVAEKTYGVLNYSIKLNDQDSIMASGDSFNILKTHAEMFEWEAASATNINVSQPSGYVTHTLSRLADNSVSGVINETGETTESDEDRYRQNHALYLFDDDENNVLKTGRISLDGGTNSPEGHASQNGNYMAFSFDTEDAADPADRGAGILIATKTFTLGGNPFDDTGSVYQLQGNSLGFNSEFNTLMNFNESSLTLNNTAEGDAENDCSASLELKRTYIHHRTDPAINRILNPASDSSVSSESLSCVINGNMIEISFTSILEQTLTLKGFISEDDDSATAGNLISLLWIQSDNLGLVFALKEQDLSPTFN